MAVKSLAFTDFMKQLALRSKLQEKTVRKVYNELFLLLAKELRISGEMRLKRFGTFYCEERGGKDMVIPQPDGSVIRKYVEPHMNIKFRPAAEFTNYANGKIVDKESKKRLRKGQLTKSERALIKRSTKNRDETLERMLREYKEEK